MLVICYQCGKVFKKPKCWVLRTKQDFCSIQCHDIYQQIYPDIICKICGAKFRAKDYNRHSTCSIECRRMARSKDNNPNWHGGITKSRKTDMSKIEYVIWRISVFKRDNYTCQECGKRGNGILHAHHIKPWSEFPEFRYVVENGQTLCEACHIATYKKKGGNRNER